MNTSNFKTWEDLELRVNEMGGDGKEVVTAMKEHYELYGEELYLWLAGLYDAGIGGFYYSNSGRDNEPFLPDIESTEQATNLLLGSGLINDTTDLPEKMREGIVAFAKSLLDPEDGYIYHPQWGKEINDSRRGRDLTWAKQLEEQYRFTLPYPTALDRLARSERTDGEESVLAEHLRTPEALIAYLDELDWQGDAYYAGNMVAAQALQIVAAGLTDTAVKYLNEKQNPETGLWGERQGYYAINALLKISGAYTTFKSVFPNAMKAARSAIECLTSDEKCLTCCYHYNAWFSLTNIRELLNNYGGEEGKREAEEILEELIRTAPETIRATRKKVLAFAKPDGGFSYLPHCSTGFSQKMPVSIHQTVESDVNASVICSTGITRNVFVALGLEDYIVPMFGISDREKFLKALKL